jgi:hypothetical protein
MSSRSAQDELECTEVPNEVKNLCVRGWRWCAVEGVDVCEKNKSGALNFTRLTSLCSNRVRCVELGTRPSFGFGVAVVSVVETR